MQHQGQLLYLKQLVVHTSGLVLTQLTRGKIPYPEQFYEMIDYQQNAVIQNLQTIDVLCTRTDWVKIGRLYYLMPEDYDEQGQGLFISMEGAPLREPEITAKQRILQLKFSYLFAGHQQYDDWENSFE